MKLGSSSIATLKLGSSAVQKVMLGSSLVWEAAGGGGTAYYDAVMADSPIAYWRLGESSGSTAEDATANNRDLTYVNTPTLGASGAVADSDTAVGFVLASSEYAESTAFSGVVAAYPFTVEAWIKTTNNTDLMAVVSNARNASSNVFWAIDVNLGVARIGYSNTTYRVGGGINVADGNWHHLVGVFSAAGTRRIWVDGVEDTTIQTSSVTARTDLNALSIGRLGSSTPGRYFDGSIDEVAIYNVALTSTQIAAHYAAA